MSRVITLDINENDKLYGWEFSDNSNVESLIVTEGDDDSNGFISFSFDTSTSTILRLAINLEEGFLPLNAALTSFVRLRFNYRAESHDQDVNNLFINSISLFDSTGDNEIIVDDNPILFETSPSYQLYDNSFSVGIPTEYFLQGSFYVGLLLTYEQNEPERNEFVIEPIDIDFETSIHDIESIDAKTLTAFEPILLKPKCFIFPFTLSQQSWSYVGNSDAVLLYSNVGGNKNGHLLIDFKADAAQNAYIEWEGTWQELGVPVGAYVYGITSAAFDHTAKATVTQQAYVAGQLEIETPQLSTEILVIPQGDLAPLNVYHDWRTAVGNSYIDVDKELYSDPVTLRLWWTISNTGGNALQLKIDNIRICLDYGFDVGATLKTNAVFSGVTRALGASFSTTKTLVQNVGIITTSNRSVSVLTRSVVSISIKTFNNASVSVVTKTVCVVNARVIGQVFFDREDMRTRTLASVSSVGVAELFVYANINTLLSVSGSGIVVAGASSVTKTVMLPSGVGVGSRSLSTLTITEAFVSVLGRTSLSLSPLVLRSVASVSLSGGSQLSLQPKGRTLFSVTARAINRRSVSAIVRTEAFASGVGGAIIQESLSLSTLATSSIIGLTSLGASAQTRTIRNLLLMQNALGGVKNIFIESSTKTIATSGIFTLNNVLAASEGRTLLNVDAKGVIQASANALLSTIATSQIRVIIGIGAESIIRTLCFTFAITKNNIATLPSVGKTVVTVSGIRVLQRSAFAESKTIVSVNCFAELDASVSIQTSTLSSTNVIGLTNLGVDAILRSLLSSGIVGNTSLSANAALATKVNFLFAENALGGIKSIIVNSNTKTVATSGVFTLNNISVSAVLRTSVSIALTATYSISSVAILKTNVLVSARVIYQVSCSVVLRTSALSGIKVFVYPSASIVTKTIASSGIKGLGNRSVSVVTKTVLSPSIKGDLETDVYASLLTSVGVSSLGVGSLQALAICRSLAQVSIIGFTSISTSAVTRSERRVLVLENVAEGVKNMFPELSESRTTATLQIGATSRADVLVVTKSVVSASAIVRVNISSSIILKTELSVFAIQRVVASANALLLTSCSFFMGARVNISSTFICRSVASPSLLGGSQITLYAPLRSVVNDIATISIAKASVSVVLRTICTASIGAEGVVQILATTKSVCTVDAKVLYNASVLATSKSVCLVDVLGKAEISSQAVTRTLLSTSVTADADLSFNAILKTVANVDIVGIADVDVLATTLTSCGSDILGVGELSCGAALKTSTSIDTISISNIHVHIDTKTSVNAFAQDISLGISPIFASCVMRSVVNVGAGSTANLDVTVITKTVAGVEVCGRRVVFLGDIPICDLYLGDIKIVKGYLGDLCVFDTCEDCN
jgi:hypothetical protein